MQHLDIALIALWTPIVILAIRADDTLHAALSGITLGLFIAAALIRIHKRTRP